MKGSDSSMIPDAEYYQASPTSPMSSKTVVGSYSATGSWTSYTGHLKGKESKEFQERSLSGTNEYAYPGFGTVAEAEYDGEVKAREGKGSGPDVLQCRDYESPSMGDVEKGRAL